MTNDKKESRAKRLLTLFWTFFKIGAFTFGGGYAMIPLIQRETVEKHGWITEDDILEIIAIAESTPGPIAINSATFVGFRTAGVLGAACATLGVVLPSFIIISAIASVLGAFLEFRAVRYAFFGIRAGVLGLVIKALITMHGKMKKDVLSYVVAVGAFIATAILKVDIILVIIGCAIAGLVTTLIKERGGRQ